MKFTPVTYLYNYAISQYIADHHKQPDENEKFNMFAKAEFDYKHMSTHDKMMLERYVKEYNTMLLSHKLTFDKTDPDYMRSKRKKSINSKPKSKRKRK